MKKNNTINLILTAAVGIGAIVSLFLLRKKGPIKSLMKYKSGSKPLDKSTCIAILKELKRELFPLLNEIMMDSRRIHEEAGVKISVAEIKDILFHHDKNYKQELKEINIKVLSKHEINEVDFEFACEKTFKDDAEVKELITELRTNLEKALKGELLDITTNIPSFLTPEYTLELMAKVMKNNLRKMKEIFDNLKQEGEQISLNNKKVLEALKSLKVDSMRIAILSAAGLNDFDEPPSKIFQYAIQRYSLMNPSGFLNDLEKLERQHQKAMESLLRDTDLREKYIEEVGVHLQEKLSIIKEVSEESQFGAKNFDPLSRSEVKVDLNKELTNSAPPGLGNKKKQSVGKKEIVGEQELVDSAIETFFQVISGLDHSSIHSTKEEQKINDDSDDELFKSAIGGSWNLIENTQTQGNDLARQTDVSAHQLEHGHEHVAINGEIHDK